MIVAKFDRAWLWAGLAVVWMGVIYALSDRPADDFDGAADATLWLPFATTIAHVGLYLVLSAFVLRTLVLWRPVSEGLIGYSTVFFAFVYGVLDEVHQSKVEGRASEVGDVAADVFGAVVVVVVWFFVKKYRQTVQDDSSDSIDE